MALFVRTSSETLSDWNRQRIVDALLRETTIDRETAESISREVEEQIIASKISLVTAPLVRELVDAKLIEKGLEEARKMHTRLGVPLYDVDQLILHPNRENANVPHGPEATNLTLAERIKKEYALLNVFSQEVGDAHMRGDLHLHDLGFIDRPYCSGQSLEYIKKFGLNLPNSLSMAKPAKHPEVLLAHMVKFAAALQSNFAGAIGWDAVNLFFAPYLEGLSDREVHQLAQMLIYEFSQQAVARGGQAIFTDINLYWEVPKHFEDVMAIGPGGEFTGKTYAEYCRRGPAFRLGALRCVPGGGCRRPALLLSQAPGPHHGKVFSNPRTHGFPAPHLRCSGGKGKHLFCLRPGEYGQGLRMLPALLQTGADRTWKTPSIPGACGIAPCRTLRSTCPGLPTGARG